MVAPGHDDDEEGCEDDGGTKVTVPLAVSIQAAERRLAELASEIGKVVEAGPAAEREALREYAISLVRESVPAGDSYYGETVAPGDVEVEREPTSRSSSAASLVGYGVLLLPVGFLLSIIFPFGLFLVVAGVGMIGMGVLVALVGRFVPKRTGAGDS